MSIELFNVSKIYGSQKAVDEISFAVPNGQIVGFLGPNGAGKSTTMKMITSFLKPSNGLIKVCDIAVDDEPELVKRKIGYLPENNPLYLDMYIREYLYYSAQIYGLKDYKAKAEEVIELTGLTPERHKKIGQLSKGYRQRVGLAQAIQHNPEVLILDEPTTGLDPNQIIEIRELIKQMGASKTVLLSTHILQEVVAICDRIIIINRGKIVADAMTTDINKLISVRNKYVATFDKPIQVKNLAQALGNVVVDSLTNQQYQIQSNDDRDLRAAIFNYAVTNQLTLLSLQEERDSLEDIFRTITTQQTQN